MMINPEYAKPILTIANVLSLNNIPHSINVLWEGLQIRFPWNDGDIICHGASYGHEDGYVESMGCPWDEGDVSCISVEDAVVYLVAWWTMKKE